MPRIFATGFVSVNRGLRVWPDGFQAVQVMQGRVSSAFTSLSNLHDRVAEAFTVAGRERVQGEFTLLGKMMNNPGAVFTSLSRMSQAVVFSFSAKAEITNVIPVQARFKSVSVIEPDMEVLELASLSVQLIADGVDVFLSSVSISISEDSPHIEATVVLRNVGDFHNIRIQQSAELVVGADTYSLVVLETSISHSEEGPQAGLRLVSPVALMAMNDRLITKTWEATTASAAMAEILSPIVVDWQIEDWNLPDKRLSLTKVTALSGAQSLAAAAGAVLQSNKDGSVKVQYKHPTPVEGYGDATILYAYDSISEVFSLTETVSTVLAANKLRILDVPSSAFADKIEHDQVGKKLLVFPSPWRENLNVTHTSLGSVILTPRGSVELEKEELTLEFKDGTATVAYPIWGIVSVVWLGKDLGGVLFSQFGTTFTSTNLTEKFSVARVKYKTKALEWGVVSDQPVVQFLVEE